MNLVKGARRSCRLNVNLSAASKKQETSDLPKVNRHKFRNPRRGTNFRACVFQAPLNGKSRFEFFTDFTT